MVNTEKLAKLREKYGNAKGGDMFDPHFKEVGETPFFRQWRTQMAVCRCADIS